MNTECIFEVVDRDITTLHCDVIVNAANTTLLGGGGVDGAIHRAAGPGLRTECQGLNGCEVGEAKWTGGHRLPVRGIIHTVGPRWQGGHRGEAEALARCYRNSIALAQRHQAQSIAFPCISTGVYGYPAEQAAEVALQAVRLAVQGTGITQVIFCCMGRNHSLYQALLKQSTTAPSAPQPELAPELQTLYRQLHVDRALLRVKGEETLSILEAGSYQAPSGRWVHIQPQIAASCAGTRFFAPEDPAFTRQPVAAFNHPTRVEVQNTTSLAAVRYLQKLGHIPAVLNLASASKPGGGFLNGARAQEEYLARSSTLYASLKLQQAFYDLHQGGDDFYSDAHIYSPNVLVIRDDDGQLLEQPYPCAMLTAAAVHASHIQKNAPTQAARIAPVMRQRIHKLLTLAEFLGHRSLVLGAWGCGAFGNDGDLIAQLFAQALREDFRGAFTHIVFAIADWSPEQKFIAPFIQALQTHNNGDPHHARLFG